MVGVAKLIFGPPPVNPDHGNSCIQATHNPRVRAIHGPASPIRWRVGSGRGPLAARAFAHPK
jgi:hypothetical protein